jgi:alanine racemase
VDLDALTQNYRTLRAAAAPAACAAVVKADAYGLGLDAIAAALHAAGCEHYFVANAVEGERLRRLLTGSRIYVLAGAEPGDEARLRDAQLVPVLNSLAQIRRWVSTGAAGPSAAVIHIDTGMTRLGLDADEAATLAGDKALLERLTVEFVMTHLACADEPEHPLNEQQLQRFDIIRGRLPAARTSIGSSAGIFSGARHCGDLARPGIALYGGNPFVDRPNPMATVARLYSPILQVRELNEAVTVGYGATYRIEAPARVATVGAGYADGYPRALGNTARAYLGDTEAAVIGRVSMDMLTIDVSNVPKDRVYPGAMVELLGDHVSLDEVASRAGTISYELLTRLGPRWTRRYERRGEQSSQ